MEGGSLFNPGFLGSSFDWWVGQVPDSSVWRENIKPSKHADALSTPGWGRRYKVRIIGIHSFDQNSLKDIELPWAQVMYPVTGGGGNRGSGATANIQQGMFVFGFFLDGRDQQVPVIMGVLGTDSQTELSTSTKNSVSETSPGSIATSGYAKGKKKSTRDKEKVKPPIIGHDARVVKKPQSLQDRLESTIDLVSSVESLLASGDRSTLIANFGNVLNQFGLLGPVTDGQISDANKAVKDANASGLTKGKKGSPERAKYDRFVTRAVKRGIKNRQQIANSPESPSQPGASKEGVDNVHQQSIGDVVADDKLKEKVIVSDVHDRALTAIKNIQTELSNLSVLVEKYASTAGSYVDKASSIITSARQLNKAYGKTACAIAKWMKVIFDIIMEYVMKQVNQGLRDVIANMPVSTRRMFMDMKEVIIELILCLYGKLTDGLCGNVEKLLQEDINHKQLKNQIKNEGMVSPCAYTSVPICAAESMVGEILSIKSGEIEDANDQIMESIQGFLDEIKGVLDVISNISSGDFNLDLPDISGNLSEALALGGIKLNVFGCEIAPLKGMQSWYTFGNGGESQPDSQKPSYKEIDDLATLKYKPNLNRHIRGEEVPFVPPSQATDDVDLAVKSVIVQE